MHLVDKHFFPKDYDFYIVNDGIDHRTSMLRSGRHRRQSSAKHYVSEVPGRVRQNSTQGPNLPKESNDNNQDGGTATADADKTTPTPSPRSDADMEGLTGAMSSLNFVPSSVRFGRGRGRGRGGFSRT